MSSALLDRLAEPPIMMKALIIALITIAWAPASGLAGDAMAMINMAIVHPKMDCKALVSLNITDVGGTGSAIVSAYHTTKTGIRYCAVDGTLATDISFTALLPVDSWTQRYMQTGCGGFCGMVDIHMSVADGSPEVSKGEFALSSNDMAGGMGDATWGLIRNRRVDFAYLANHLNALAAKKIIQAYYGQQPAFSYFNGCSDGGREAVMEAIRYPDDFNGIIAGAPAMMWLIQNTFHHAWQTLSNLDDRGHSILHWSKKALIHSAVMEACDHLDGLVDGLLQDPRLCDFDPVSIQCSDDSVDWVKCLTAAEVGVVRKMYAGSVDKATGLHLTQGEGMYGSESGWNLPFFSQQDTIGSSSYGARVDMVINTLRYFAFEHGVPDNFTLKDFEFSMATMNKLRPRHPLFDATSPNISAFKAAGGKLILWHGFSDPDMAPRVTIAYHEAIQRFFGENAAEQFERLYLLPGVYHCGSGYGMAGVDFVSPLLQWVELGKAPNGIMTKATPGYGPLTQFVHRSRPVFPYPSLPEYTGQGDPNDGANYVQGPPLYHKLSPRWAGEDFFVPFVPSDGSEQSHGLAPVNEVMAIA